MLPNPRPRVFSESTRNLFSDDEFHRLQSAPKTKEIKSENKKRLEPVFSVFYSDEEEFGQSEEEVFEEASENNGDSHNRVLHEQMMIEEAGLANYHVEAHHSPEPKRKKSSEEVCDETIEMLKLFSKTWTEETNSNEKKAIGSQAPVETFQEQDSVLFCSFQLFCSFSLRGDQI